MINAESFSNFSNRLSDFLRRLDFILKSNSYNIKYDARIILYHSILFSKNLILSITFVTFNFVILLILKKSILSQKLQYYSQFGMIAAYCSCVVAISVFQNRKINCQKSYLNCESDDWSKM